MATPFRITVHLTREQRKALAHLLVDMYEPSMAPDNHVSSFRFEVSGVAIPNTVPIILRSDKGYSVYENRAE